jgi:ferredoxin-NADP reductase
MSAEENEQVLVTRLVRRTVVAENTMAFEFEKPEEWKFKAGQFVEVTLIDPPETDFEGASRPLSIASAPDEPHILLATRMRDSAFKRVLKSLPMNAQVRIEGPLGNFVLHNDPSRHAVLISGGIGITPVRSIVMDAAHQKLPHRIFLFYANRRPQDAPFLDEIRSLAEENDNFTFVPIITGTALPDQPWKGETGRITGDLIRKYAGDPLTAVYYLCGPVGMVSTLRESLRQAGIACTDIRSEEFAGY